MPSLPRHLGDRLVGPSSTQDLLSSDDGDTDRAESLAEVDWNSLAEVDWDSLAEVDPISSTSSRSTLPVTVGRADSVLELTSRILRLSALGLDCLVCEREQGWFAPRLVFE